MRSTIKAQTVTIIGVLAGIAGLLGINLGIAPKWLPETQLAVAFVCLIGFYFFVAYVYGKARAERSSRYAEAFQDVSIGFSAIHKLWRKRQEASEDDILNSFQTLLDGVATAFSSITGTKCAACIKILSRSDGQVVAQLLCRDKVSQASRKPIDEKTRRQRVKHTLERNTAFRKAIHDRSFICNRLPFYRPYDNSTFELCDSGGIADYNLWKPWTWRRWPLPYKSTIVVPIVPLTDNFGASQRQNDDVGGSASTDDSLEVGFLCVDSRRMAEFRSEIDVDIMRGIADGIYNAIMFYKERLNDIVKAD